VQPGKKLKASSEMIIDHICIAVKEIGEGIAYWEKVFGYEQMTGIVVNSLQKVKVAFLKKENSLTIKIIEPLEENLSLVNFVSRGGGFHHICFRCDNINDELKELKEKGLITLVPPQPGEAFNNHDIAFLLARYGLNIELIDTDERAEIIGEV
jgi:methylmalonyl-CoA/ethylmalonyl-CoA epimerase